MSSCIWIFSFVLAEAISKYLQSLLFPLQEFLVLEWEFQEEDITQVRVNIPISGCFRNNGMGVPWEEGDRDQAWMLAFPEENQGQSLAFPKQYLDLSHYSGIREHFENILILSLQLRINFLHMGCDQASRAAWDLLSCAHPKKHNWQAAWGHPGPGRRAESLSYSIHFLTHMLPLQGLAWKNKPWKNKNTRMV